VETEAFLEAGVTTIVENLLSPTVNHEQSSGNDRSTTRHRRGSALLLFLCLMRAGNTAPPQQRGAGLIGAKSTRMRRF